MGDLSSGVNEEVVEKVSFVRKSVNFIEFVTKGDSILVTFEDKVMCNEWQVKVHYNGALPRIIGRMEKKSNGFMLKLVKDSIEDSMVVIRIEKLVYGVIPHGSLNFIFFVSTSLGLSLWLLFWKIDLKEF